MLTGKITDELPRDGRFDGLTPGWLNGQTKKLGQVKTDYVGNNG